MSVKRLIFIYLWLLTAVTLILPLSSFAAAKELLKLQIDGVDGALKRNILAHLGPLPENDAQRRAWLFDASNSVQDALQSLGYYHGKLKQQLVENDKGPWQLTLTVTPGDVTHIQWVDIVLDGEILNDPVVNQWLDQVSIRPGDNLNHGSYESVKAQLATLALSRGYFDGHYSVAEIRVNRELNLAKINLRYDSGKRYHFGHISFEGQILEAGFLDKLVPFEPNATYSARRLSSLNQQLVDTGYFDSIKVLPQVDKLSDDQVPVKVELSPKPDHSFQVGLGADIGNSAGSEIEPRVKLIWRTPQINRFGHFQETSIEWSPDRPKMLFTYTIPLSHPLDDQLKLRFGLLWDKYGVTQELDSATQQFSNTGQLESRKRLIGVGRNKRLGHGWLFNYSLDALREQYTQADVTYDPQFFLFGASISKTVRGDASLDPKSGYRQLYSVAYADPTLGSDARLSKFEARFKWIDTFFDKHRFVARLDLGLNVVTDNDLILVPPSLRYFAGGDQSIRGYSYQELGPYREFTNSDGVLSREVIGGRYLAVGSVEYQYYLTPQWRVATFVDAGNAYDNGQMAPIVSVGGGVHWISPLGPIKLDIGFGVHDPDIDYRPWRIHLTMGSEL
ncbi:outer membrane protein assembly factor [Shewanella yunxiaonensis]|uniref:Translocation and assembly module subunit TamA n=1 Tax=Shewanella yunxiaonensis TaxID=2829809 RepID=A0ABX7YZK8_9GAMM|nr:outer membrane protein assembly factor [Shewanella yunxiaonensis]